MAFTPDQKREYRKRQRAKGLCYVCGIRHVTSTNSWNCAECSSIKRRSDRSKAQSDRCNICGRPAMGAYYCVVHQANANHNRMIRRSL